MLAVVACCPRVLGRRQILSRLCPCSRAGGWPFEGQRLCAFALLEQQLLFWVPTWGCPIIPEQMNAACCGRGGRPVWAAEERLGHGTPVGHESQELVVEVHLMQGW